MFQQFVDRFEELDFLEKEYKKDRPAFIIIYGRRRVGKTELIKQFLIDKPSIYFLADTREDLLNIKEMQKFMADFLKDSLFEKADIREWIELFSEFSKKIKSKVTIVIDEFPYLIMSNKNIPSIFQKIWDNYLSKKEVFLVLLGSSIEVMETEVLGYKSPLYGRRTGQLKILPLRFKYLMNFFRSYSTEDLIKVFSLTDGIPAYILCLNPKLSFVENLKDNVFRSGSYLYQEAEILLRQELREPSKYFNILKAIAIGKSTFGEIVNFTQFDKTLVSKYLNTLLLLHVVKKEFPVTQKKEVRNARYVIEDNYFNFWFRFVYPNKTLIEAGKVEELIDIIQNDLNIYVSRIFEKVCREFLFEQSPFVFNKIGKWWHKEKEIDIVALNEQTKEILFCECKWQDKVNAYEVLKEIKEKAKFVDWNKDKRKEYYFIFTKSFSKKIEDKNVFLIDLNELKNIFKKS